MNTPRILRPLKTTALILVLLGGCEIEEPIDAQSVAHESWRNTPSGRSDELPSDLNQQILEQVNEILEREGVLP